MTQENGMPTKAPIIYGEKFILKAWKLEWDDNGELMDVWTNKPRDIYRPERVIICYPIGATDSSDPKQELYFGDLIEFIDDEGEQEVKYIGELVWNHYAVRVKFSYLHPQRGKQIEFYTFQILLEDGRPLKKLGSRYTKEGQEISKKAGLEKPETKTK